MVDTHIDKKRTWFTACFFSLQPTQWTLYPKVPSSETVHTNLWTMLKTTWVRVILAVYSSVAGNCLNLGFSQSFFYIYVYIYNIVKHKQTTLNILVDDIYVNSIYWYFALVVAATALWWSWMFSEVGRWSHWHQRHHVGRWWQGGQWWHEAQLGDGCPCIFFFSGACWPFVGLEPILSLNPYLGVTRSY